jgi:hypothetical protein
LPVSLLEVDYDETVADVQGVPRRLVEWSGLDWEPACLAFHEGKQPMHIASVMQVRHSLYTKSVARRSVCYLAATPLPLSVTCGSTA